MSVTYDAGEDLMVPGRIETIRRKLPRESADGASDLSRMGGCLEGPPRLAGLEALLEAANRDLSSTAARLCELCDRATALAAAAEEEQAQLRRFLEEFGLEQSIDDEPTPFDDGGLGSFIDIAALRRGATALAEDVARCGALRGNLAAVLQMVRACQDHLDPQRALRTVQAVADVRLQQAMYVAREDERRRLAREMHDGPAQVLANAIYATEIAEQVGKRAPDQLTEELARVRGLLKEGASEVRRFMFDLRPSMLQDQGLAPTLRRYVDDYGRFFRKRVSLTITEPLPSLSAEQELTIFRIVQEALQNIHKHALVEEAAVEVIHDGHGLRTTIADRGRGFRPNGMMARSDAGAGLPGMRERAKLIGAELMIVTAPGAGTTIQLVMPLRNPIGLLESGSLSGVGGVA